jgi:hypothetical protein
LGEYFYGYLNNKEITITVSDKYIKRSGETDIYLVVDENKNTYKGKRRGLCRTNILINAHIKIQTSISPTYGLTI